MTKTEAATTVVKYAAPKLKVLGDMAVLTAAGSAGETEGNSSSANKARN